MCDDCMEWSDDEDDMVEVEGCTCACTGDSLETQSDGKVVCKDCGHEVKGED